MHSWGSYQGTTQRAVIHMEPENSLSWENRDDNPKKPRWLEFPRHSAEEKRATQRRNPGLGTIWVYPSGIHQFIHQCLCEETEASEHPLILWHGAFTSWEKYLVPPTRLEKVLFKGYWVEYLRWSFFVVELIALYGELLWVYQIRKTHKKKTISK